MRYTSRSWLYGFMIFLTIVTPNASKIYEVNDRIKTSVFHSPAFTLGPGSVEDKYYYGVDFPKGHIALKSLDAEVVDEDGTPIPLHETYLHHWVVVRYYGLVESETIGRGVSRPKMISGRNSGVCPKTLGQYFGLGSETRKTSTHVPDPYGIEVGNSDEIPEGYEEKWMLNVHAIDTRGVEDRLGCTECKCSLYNVTHDQFGRQLSKDYNGGLYCCYDMTNCQVREGFKDVRRKLYLKYTVRWMDWDESIVPVKIYIFDVTYKQLGTQSSDGNTEHCQVEYEIEPCSEEDSIAKAKCTDTRRTKTVLPHGGDVVYAVAHQHSGGVGSTLFGQDGRVICSSIPTYGTGSEPGNEAGYIVGMSTCYPTPGSVTIADGETLTLESNYSSSQMHTGVMGLFYILVAEPRPATRSTFIFSASRILRV